MSNSINTNVAAMMANNSLRTAGAQLDRASKTVQTGYRVADASDDASTFSVAQGIRGNLQAYGAVQQSLTNGSGLGDVTGRGAHQHFRSDRQPAGQDHAARRRVDPRPTSARSTRPT